MISQKQLKITAQLLADKISNVKENNGYWSFPYQHIQIDNFFPPEFINTALENFPEDNDTQWEWSNDADIEVKARSTWEDEFDMPEGISEIVRILNSTPMLKAMSEVLSIPKLLPDPYYTGGGLNITQRGGLLDVHVDGNYHDASGLNRRVNCLLYLNEKWDDSWGGELGLYNETGDNLVKKIAPVLNRFVIFETHDRSFHGSPDPLNFPEGESRKSVLLYYYTKDFRPASQIVVEKPHSALWKKRGLHDKRGNKTRGFS